MAFWNKLFGKKEEEQKVGGMEDFMTLIRVYFQAVMAADLIWQRSLTSESLSRR